MIFLFSLFESQIHFTRKRLETKINEKELRLKTDSKSFAKSFSTVENNVNGDTDAETPSTPAASALFGCKNPNKLFGVSPSDIDKYSRVVFPVCFVCFNLMYWIIYLHISDQLTEDLVPAH